MNSMAYEEILSNFGSDLNVVVVGASGGIGRGFIEHLADCDKVVRVFAFSRAEAVFESEKVIWGAIDYADESSIEAAAQSVGVADIVIVATGLLHDKAGLSPEKALRDINTANLAKSYLVNAIGPALVAKHFLPLLPRDRRCVFAALSARVGSISDNGLGGWTSYRAAKAALNMVIKNSAIEIGRKNKHAIIVALHPGTVDTSLSEPFQGHVPDGKLFTPAYATGEMLSVLNGLSVQDTGKIFDYKGEEIEP